MASRDVVSYRVRFPLVTDAKALEAFLVGLSSLPGPSWYRLFTPAFVGIETIGTPRGIEHRLSVPERWEAQVVGLLRSQIGVRLDLEVHPSAILGGHPHEPRAGAGVELRLVHGGELLRVDAPEALSTALLASLQPVGDDEVLRVQWLLTPAPPNNPYPSAYQPQSIGAPWPQRLDPRRRQKAQDVPFLAVCRLTAQASSDGRARQLVRRPLSVLRSARYGWNRLRPRFIPGSLVARRAERRTLPLLWPARLTARELVAVSGLPTGTPTVAGLRLGVARQLPPAHELPRRGRVLLHSTFPGAERPVAMTVRGALGHLFLLGPTGSGKSALLANLAVSDMRRRYGVVLLDPKGDTANDVLGAIPDSRVDDVIYLDPADESPVGFNLLSAKGDRLEITVDQVVAWFARRYKSSWGPRSDDLARHALRTLAATDHTLVELPLLVGSEVYRRKVVGSLTDDLLKGFWAWFDSLSAPERAHISAPLLNKARALLGRRHLRAIVGQHSPGWSMEEVLADGRILIINLAKGLIGEDASALLGSLLLSRLWLATLARAKLPQQQRRPAFLLVDEFADFVGTETGFGDFLAQARGLGVALTLATQHLGQLPATLRDDVLTNARSKLTFAASADDAATFAREFQPQLDASDLQQLGAYEAAARIFTGTRMAPPVTGTTPDPLTVDRRRQQEVCSRSRSRYGRSREAIDEEIRERQATSRPGGAVGRRRIAP